MVLWKEEKDTAKGDSKGINPKLVFRDGQRAKITSKKSEEKKFLMTNIV